MDQNYPILSSILGFTIFSFLFVFLLLRKPKKLLLPPGPYPLPIIGNLHMLDVVKPHQSLAKLSQKHGPIMCLKLGQVTTIVITSPLMAKEVLQKQDLAFCNRYVRTAGEALDHNHSSVIWLPVAQRWRLHRRIMNSNLFSSSKLDANEHLRLNKVEELIEYCKRKSQTGEAVNIRSAVFTTMVNLISNLIFSKDLSDPFHLEAQDEFKTLIKDVVEIIGKNNVGDLFPVLKKFDPQGIKAHMEHILGQCRKVFSDLIDERLEQTKSQPSAVYNDVLDILLSSIDQEEDPEEFDKDQFWHLCVDLFSAGIDTMTDTTEWAMAELLRNPETMRTSKEELIRMIGKSKQLKEVDIARLPYLSSIIKETLRLHPPAPLLIPRKTEEAVQLCGYTIPKNSQILVNVWAIGRDSKIWDHGSEFRPKVFLESEIDFRGRNFELLPFGAGRRICPGLPLATRMLPCILGSLINALEWKLDGDISPQELDMEEGPGITLPRAHPLKAIPCPL